ncbi:restriction endonuclease subunit S [Verrucomicrobium sp. BvORR034]|uniref:restriction endonuclease subunit S n=1 Tax=Verrucomicrobium sp. BvORR034 TaxID=1396418 RepID=UPI00067858FF|nr:restriction endonuclease subunit S [Verrucomicrobium sp. BvORR034]
MTLETFFEKFDLFADAPNAVGKMRELVLELAVQGRLVSQDTKEESAHALLERISSSAKTRHRDSNEVDGVVAPFEIPETWAWVPLPRVLEKLTDGTHHSPPNGPSGEFMYVTAKNIKTDGVLLDGITYVSKEVHDEIYSRCDPSFGDVLYIKDGATTGVATINQVKEPFSMLSSVALLKPSKAVSNRYLLWAMRSPFFYQETRGAMKGAAITRVTLSVMAASLLPLPPLAEQKRIVAKVDELMSLCDRLEAQQHERERQHAALARASLARFTEAPTPANLDFLFHQAYAIPPAALRKSILTLAVQGKLVHQDPNDEPAEKILANIADDVLKAVRAKRMRSFRPFSAHKHETPFDLPAGWAWAPLGNLMAAEDGAMCDGPFGSKLKTEHYVPAKGYAVLRLGNIGVGYFIHGKEGHISREHFESLPSNHVVPGDLLVAGLADPLVRCCEVPQDIGPAVNKSDCFRVRLSKHIDRSYVRHFLNSPIAKAFAAEENHGMTRERINLSGAKALPVSVPPLAEQRRIVAKVDELMALVDALEAQLTAARATANNLFGAAVAELTSSN